MGLSWHGVVSDAQESIRTAVSKELPGVPHQACQSHCLRKAGDLTFQADRNMKKRLADYADAMRTTLLEGGVAPFALGGMRVFDDLTALAASLTRCQEKGGMCFCVV
jgi:hypothetical protein